MENFEDVTDDLLGLPGFIRRNLLLMRELDLSFVSHVNEAKRKEQETTSSSSDPKADTSVHNDIGDIQNGPSSTPTRHMSIDPEKSEGSSRSYPNRTKETSDNSAKVEGNNAKRVCRSGSSELPPTASRQAAQSSEQPTADEIYDIQKLRMDAMYLLQEKLAINDQITCMLKHEYENLKVVFDNMYREMEMNGQMTEKLKMSFTVSKSKHIPTIDTILSQTEMDIMDGSPGAASQEKETGPMTRMVSMNSGNNSTQNKDTNYRQKDGSLHK